MPVDEVGVGDGGAGVRVGVLMAGVSVGGSDVWVAEGCSNAGVFTTGYAVFESAPGVQPAARDRITSARRMVKIFRAIVFSSPGISGVCIKYSARQSRFHFPERGGKSHALVMILFLESNRTVMRSALRRQLSIR
jgi:hypothetical protein